MSNQLSHYEEWHPDNNPCLGQAQQWQKGRVGLQPMSGRPASYLGDSYQAQNKRLQVLILPNWRQKAVHMCAHNSLSTVASGAARY